MVLFNLKLGRRLIMVKACFCHLPPFIIIPSKPCAIFYVLTASHVKIVTTVSERFF